MKMTRVETTIIELTVEERNKLKEACEIVRDIYSNVSDKTKLARDTEFRAMEVTTEQLESTVFTLSSLEWIMEQPQEIEVVEKK